MLSIFNPATVAQLTRVIVEAVAAEWKAQGHNLTGQAIQEIEDAQVHIARCNRSVHEKNRRG